MGGRGRSALGEDAVLETTRTEATIPGLARGDSLQNLIKPRRPSGVHILKRRRSEEPSTGHSLSALDLGLLTEFCEL